MQLLITYTGAQREKHCFTSQQDQVGEGDVISLGSSVFSVFLKILFTSYAF